MGISCKQATEYIVKKEEGKITLWQRYQLWRHLAICNLCKFFGKQDHLISSSLKQSGKHNHDALNNSDKDDFIKAMMEGKKNDD